MPDRALAQQPVGRQPRAARARAAPTTRTRTARRRTRGRAIISTRPLGDEIHRDRQRRPGHPEVEVARDGEVVGERRIFEVAHSRRAHAGLGQPVVQPRGGAVPEIGADRLMDRRQHLEQEKGDADERQRARQAVALPLAMLGHLERQSKGGKPRRPASPCPPQTPPAALRGGAAPATRRGRADRPPSAGPRRTSIRSAHGDAGTRVIPPSLLARFAQAEMDARHRMHVSAGRRVSFRRRRSSSAPERASCRRSLRNTSRRNR